MSNCCGAVANTHRNGVLRCCTPLSKRMTATPAKLRALRLEATRPSKRLGLQVARKHLEAKNKVSGQNRTSRKKYGRSARSALPLRRRRFAGNRKAGKPLTSAFYGFPCAPRSLSVPFARPDMLAENAVERRLCSPQYRSNITDCSSLRGNVHVLCTKRACL